MAEAEDLQVAKALKRVKKAELLQAKLSRERDALLGRTAEPQQEARGSPRPGLGQSWEGTPRGGDLQRTLVRGGGGRVTRRIRDLHPPLESCRSVYCYEVSLRSFG